MSRDVQAPPQVGTIDADKDAHYDAMRRDAEAYRARGDTQRNPRDPKREDGRASLAPDRQEEMRDATRG